MEVERGRHRSEESKVPVGKNMGKTETDVGLLEQETVPFMGTSLPRETQTLRGRMQQSVQTMIGRERKGSETRTWALAGAILGTLIGSALAVFEVVWFNMGYLGYQPGASSQQMNFIGYVAAPIVLILFGAFAGTLIGVGTPRHNPHPQQGRGRAYHFFGVFRRPSTERSKGQPSYGHRF